jgi:hypothetical protein
MQAKPAKRPKTRKTARELAVKAKKPHVFVKEVNKQGERTSLKTYIKPFSGSWRILLEL